MNEPDLARSLLRSARTIAVVGYSAKPDRPSNSVSAYLRRHGYRIIPVNPQLRRATIEGERSYDRLTDVPASEPLEVVQPVRLRVHFHVRRSAARDEVRRRYARVRARVALRVHAPERPDRDALPMCPKERAIHELVALDPQLSEVGVVENDQCVECQQPDADARQPAVEAGGPERQER